jgi:formylglycine-generating enzyme required for sulfatase activity
MIVFQTQSGEGRSSVAGPISWKRIGWLSLFMIPFAVSGFAATPAKKPASKSAASSPAPQASGKKLAAYSESLPNSVVKFDMVPIQGGTFMFSDATKGNKPVKTAVKSFWIGKTELTWEPFDIFAYGFDLANANINADAAALSRPSRPYGAPDRGFGHAGYPVISETYYAAEQFCVWLSLMTGKKYRLPTEAEWEYACRAGAADAKPMDKKALGEIAWFYDNGDDSTHPVGKKKPNAWGLYDMMGNVLEWCKGPDGKPVAKGGSWREEAKDVTCAARFFQDSSWNSTDPQNPKSKWWLSDGNFIGFRVVREE